MHFQLKQSKMIGVASVLSLLLSLSSSTLAFTVHNNVQQTTRTTTALFHNDDVNEEATGTSNRRLFLSTTTATAVASILPSIANADDVSFETIAERAARVAKIVEAEEANEDMSKDRELREKSRGADTRTAYEFSLPVAGESVPFGEMIKQEFGEVNAETGERDVKVKAIVVLNIKQDDPIARRDIAELIALASKFGRTGEFAVVCCPTDQGYYEPDTSALIRLKMASEYGYGINPATVVTDKLILLGTGAHPFWRWIQGTCRTPAGLGKIQVRFFLYGLLVDLLLLDERRRTWNAHR
mmetsp:Transcript_32631/g.47846  ORF Transcript_32631/g.47846 Transcript_32631/m.47846 type:complete len:298 (+) Transcript_32631:137-1030(+)